MQGLSHWAVVTNLDDKRVGTVAQAAVLDAQGIILVVEQAKLQKLQRQARIKTLFACTPDIQIVEATFVPAFKPFGELLPGPQPYGELTAGKLL